MKVRILYFSLLRDVSECEEESVALGGSADVAQLIEKMYARHPGLREWDKSLLVAVNGEYADRGTSLSEGDEVALMPPVQGG